MNNIYERYLNVAQILWAAPLLPLYRLAFCQFAALIEDPEDVEEAKRNIRETLTLKNLLKSA